MELSKVCDEHAIVNSKPPLVEQQTVYARTAIRQRTRGMRPSSHLQDLWKAPLHDLPIRDEILYQFLPASGDEHVLEIGPGAGFTAYCISRMFKTLTLLDVSAEHLAVVQKALSERPNVSTVCADICAPGLSGKLHRTFDIIEAIEVFEFLPDPANALRNMAAAIRPGGRLFLQFPNYRPPRSHGVTYFENRQHLDDLLRASGFTHWEIYSLRLRPYSNFVFRNLHERPLQFYRWLRRKQRPVRPQTYQDVWAFRARGSLERYKCLLHAFWSVVMFLLRARGDCFVRSLLYGEIMDRNLLVIAER